MSRQVALVTGAGGEMGSLLIPALESHGFDVVALDLVALPEKTRAHCRETVEASILDEPVVRGLFERHRPHMVFHLAAVLSSKAERDPDLAHQVNVDGTYDLFRLCREFGSGRPKPPRFMFPSSIAVYGFPDVETKNSHGAVKEWQWTVPAGMYGCNKLYCELLGTYLTGRGSVGEPQIDFRAIRFPGLISADTLPSSGTTDYAPEMIHAAAQGRPYRAFVDRESRLPFMTMPDAVDAFLKLAAADAASLTTRIYNIRAFSASTDELRRATLEHFPEAELGFESVQEKQVIVDSWPADVDDSKARRDWELAPRHGLTEALAGYLVPALVRRYADARVP